MRHAPTHPSVTTERTPLALRLLLGLSLVLISGAIFLVSLYITVGFDRQTPSRVTAYPSAIAVDFSNMPVATPLSFPSRMEMVMIEPTPTATSVVPTKVPTQAPFLCPNDPRVLPLGTECVGPALPLPTPTPLPSCTSTPVPGVTCIVRDSVVAT